MKEYLEFKDYNSHKFWQIEITGNDFKVTYGKIGTDGREQVKSFASAEEANKEAKKLISQKLKKGYEKKLEPSATEYKIGMTIDPSKSYKFFQDYDATDGTAVEQLEDFIKQENSDKITKIVIGVWGDHEDTPDAVLKFLIANKDKFKAVKHFHIGDIESEENEMSWINQTNLESFLKEFSTIEKLELRGGSGLKLGNINLPNLKMLRIETGGMDNVVIENLIASKNNLTNLEYLELWLGTDEYGGDVELESLKKLFADNAFPKLKHLGLMNSDIQDDIVQYFANHPIVERLEVLDFSMGILKDEGGKALLANDKLLALQKLDCEFNFMSDKLIKELTKKFPNGNFDPTWAKEDWDEDDEDERYYYVEVGE